MFCQKCGSSNAPDGRFCAHCGAALSAADPSASWVQTAQVPNENPGVSAIPAQQARQSPLRKTEWGGVLLLAVSVLIFLGKVVPAFLMLPSYLDALEDFALYYLTILGAPVFAAMVVVAVVYFLLRRPSMGLAITGYVLGGLGLLAEIGGSTQYLSYMKLLFDAYGDEPFRLMNMVLSFLLDIFVSLLPMICYIVFFVVSYRQRRAAAARILSSAKPSAGWGASLLLFSAAVTLIQQILTAFLRLLSEKKETVETMQIAFLPVYIALAVVSVIYVFSGSKGIGFPTAVSILAGLAALWSIIISIVSLGSIFVQGGGEWRVILASCSSCLYALSVCAFYIIGSLGCRKQKK